MNRGVTLLMLGLLSIVQLSTAAVIEVPDDYPLIQMALDSCSSGDTVLVAPGHYFERLEIPERNLTLASHWLLTGDSLHIRQTIIDADSLGRVIRTRTGNGGNRLIVDGLTICGGVNTEQSRGTGIEINDNTDVALRNLYFEDNYSAWDGACIFIVGRTLDPPRAELKNIKGRNNRSIASVLSLISVYVEHTAILDGLHMDSLDCGLITFGASLDTCVVRNIRTTHNTSSQTMIAVGMANATENSYQEYENISITNSEWHGSQLINISGNSAATVRNICLEDNVRVGDRDGSGNMFNPSIGAGSVYDNLIARRSRGAVVGATGGSLRLYRLPNDEPSHGYIRNLIIEGNVLGDSSYTPWNGLYSPAMLTVKNLCIDGAVIRNNTHVLTPGPEDPEWGVSGACLINVDEQSTDSLILKNMLFEHNLVIDRDDNDALSMHGANSGRCIQVESIFDYDYFLMDSLVFDSNLQPNMFTEEPYGGWLNDGADIGSLCSDTKLYRTNRSRAQVFREYGLPQE